MKALVYKELREVRGIALVALAAYSVLVLSLMGVKAFEFLPVPIGTNEVPFVGSEFGNFYALVTIGLALALGFRQSAWESTQETYLFLLHRPVSRNAIFLTKLAVGTAVLLACASAPILSFGWWASIPGHIPGPFVWSMTGSAWFSALFSVVLYLGAFLTGIRPARWFGTRLLPVLATTMAPIALAEMSGVSPLSFPFLALAGCGLFLVSICFVARERNYA